MNMKLVCAAAIAAMATPTMAQAATGYLDLSYSNVDLDDGADDVNVITYGGALNFDLSDTLEVQTDAHWSRIENGASVTLDQAAVHLFHRNDTYAYGFVASVEDLSVLGGQVYDLGIEGQYFFNRLTVDAAVSFANFDTLSEDGVRYELGASFFPTDNFAFGGGGERLELNGGGEIDVLSANLEYQPDASAVSYFAAYRAADDRLFTTNDYDTVEVGIRYNFGTGSLIERSRSGASKRAAGTFVRGAY